MVGRAVLAAVLACSLLVAPRSARAEIATTGMLEADFDGSLPTFTFQGNATFDAASPDFFVAGQPVDLDGDFPAGASIDNGLLIFQNFNFDLHASSTSGAFLRLDGIAGTAQLCQSAGCPLPAVTFLGVPSAVSFSQGVLPVTPRLYLLDGTVGFGGTAGLVTGPYGLNAFPLYETSVGGPILLDTGIDIFYDSVKQQVVPYAASVEFSAVTTGGNTTIAPVSAASGGLPANIELNVGGVESTFVEVRTQAEFDPPVTVCLEINPDADPPTIPLEQLRLLHRSSLAGDFAVTDTRLLTNPDRLCADVDSLSPFVVGVDVTPGTTTTTTVETSTTSTSTSTSSTTSSSSSTSTSTSSSTSSSSSSSTSTSSSSSTSTSASTSTSSTTVPSGCTSEPTFESILCRIDALIALTAASDMTDRMRDTLLRHLTRARAVVLEAQERLDEGRTRGAQGGLKSAERRLRGYGYRARSLAGRRGIVEPAVAEQLAGDAQGIQDDVKALRKSL